MSERLEWIELEGVRVLVADFSGIRVEDEYLQAFDVMEAEILKQPEGVMVPLILDLSDTLLSPAITERGKGMMDAAGEAGIPDSPTALVGLSGFQKAVVQALQFLRRDLYVASGMEDAKGWLARQLRG